MVFEGVRAGGIQEIPDFNRAITAACD